MKLYITWSGRTGHAAAAVLGDWIPSVIQAVETIVSPEEMPERAGWAEEVSKEPNQASLAILCVVPGSPGAPWFYFEAGVLSRTLGASNVIPLLFDVERSELDDGPLARFPSVVYGKTDMYGILETINENTQKMRLAEERLRDTFALWWPKLSLDIDSLLGRGMDGTGHPGAPEAVPDAEEPEKDPAVDLPEKTPAPDEPGTGSAADERVEAPGRTVETAWKSWMRKPPEAAGPAKPAAARPVVLDELEVLMLKALYDSPGDAPMTATDVGYKLDFSAQKARECLDRLERKNYVREHLFTGRQKEYSIARKGKEYLAGKVPSNKRGAGSAA